MLRVLSILLLSSLLMAAQTLVPSRTAVNPPSVLHITCDQSYAVLERQEECEVFLAHVARVWNGSNPGGYWSLRVFPGPMPMWIVGGVVLRELDDEPRRVTMHLVSESLAAAAEELVYAGMSETKRRLDLELKYLQQTTQSLVPLPPVPKQLSPSTAGGKVVQSIKSIKPAPTPVLELPPAKAVEAPLPK